VIGYANRPGKDRQLANAGADADADSLDDISAALCLPNRCGQQRVPSLRRGSGYEQAKAKLRCVEGGEVAVAFGPPA